jgi:hypothetical protein
MGTLLLHHPLVYVYLLYVGVLWVVFVWDRLRSPQPRGRTPRTGPNEPAAVGPRLHPPRLAKRCSAPWPGHGRIRK